MVGFIWPHLCLPAALTLSFVEFVSLIVYVWVYFVPAVYWILSGRGPLLVGPLILFSFPWDTCSHKFVWSRNKKSTHFPALFCFSFLFYNHLSLHSIVFTISSLWRHLFPFFVIINGKTHSTIFFFWHVLLHNLSTSSCNISNENKIPKLFRLLKP